MSKATLQADMKELKGISNQIKKLQAEMKVLRLRKDEVEGKIMKYIETLPEEQKNSVIRFQDLTVQLKEKPVTIRKNKKEFEKSAVEKLQDELEVQEQEAKRIYQMILDEQIEEEETRLKLDVKEEKKGEKLLSKKKK
jgi:hypothetical protein